jgi:hypothetical protein
MKNPGRFLFLLLVALSVSVPASLSAQDSRYAEITVYVCPTEGGSQSDREYFDFNLQEEVRGSGYTLANGLYRSAAEAKDNSHFYIVVTLEYDEAFRENVVNTELYDTRTNNQILTSSMGYQNVEEMNEWNLTIIYSLMANAPSVKHIMDYQEDQAKWNAFLKWMEGQEQFAARYRMYFGFRGGYSRRFYKVDPLGVPYIANSEGNSFEAAFQFSYQPLSILAVQAEMVFTMDKAVLRYAEPVEPALQFPTDTYTSIWLMIPITAKATLRFDRFLVAPFGGVYLNVPLGKMEFEGAVQKDREFTVPLLGFTAGIDLGTRLGPGTLFLDIRYSSDFGRIVKTDPPPNKDEYHRSGLSLSLGYELGFSKK